MQVSSAGTRIFYAVEGNGAPLVLLHPYPGNHKFWRPLAPVLNERYRLIMPDLRCHGASETGVAEATMELHAADLEKICRTREYSKRCSPPFPLADTFCSSSGGVIGSA
ncbi:MAG TPA: alpha/beta fold hydrolase [Candidatus Angelobacter sp.]|nr:alpha/beta fold hydrolase [Candidatus Angelobacter sp.]